MAVMWLLVWSACAVCACLLAFAVWVKLNRKKPRLLRGYKPRPAYPAVTSSRPDCTRDAYRPAKVPQGVDYVIIGSGMGGLFCGGVLARAGYKVLVLEQHYVAGGCTHEFEDKGYSLYVRPPALLALRDH